MVLSDCSLEVDSEVPWAYADTDSTLAPAVRSASVRVDRFRSPLRLRSLAVPTLMFETISEVWLTMALDRFSPPMASMRTLSVMSAWA